MIARAFKTLLADKRGNFAILTALGLPLLFGAAGAGMEATRVMQVRNDMQTALDSATLAAATHARLDEGRKTDQEYADEVKKFVEDYMKGKDDKDSEEDKAKIDVTASRNDNKKGTSFKIAGSVSRQVPLNPLIGFIGVDTVTISVSSTAESSFSKGAALSLYLVLDRSGSMSFITDTLDKSKKSCDNYTEKSWPKVAFTTPCYVKKMASLQAAVSYLVDTLNKADPSYKEKAYPESELIRTGAVAYHSGSFPAQKIEWGTSAAKNYVDSIPPVPTGGTNAYPSLKIAFDALQSANPNERSQHDSKGNKMFERYILLMTDGEMSSSTIDGQVRSICSSIKADGIKIFTVAFMAPDKGKSLLKYCASSPDNYFEPDNMEEIVSAFGEIARKAASVPTRLTN
ncbi:Flp pilus assembly protein TadG [Agrobacterium larrymoorei]|uniref:Flp pilus assembly protein TadG n=1 Tax=Agrobacterium larrymoorei TaxID=160699 RepID=A0AAJ2EW84_9HYPH|nr:pilus assembly protein TadG-related protein [Agrobacterium larrymoorei]MDR6103317.1 Flp pilus assembly protein TadG [Agrobacterium larrymoorei]